MQIDGQENGMGSELEDKDFIEEERQEIGSEEQEEISKPEAEMSIEDDILESIKQVKSKQEGENKEELTEEPQGQQKTSRVEFEPPARFTAEEREQFNKLPRNMKPIVKKAFEEMQADYTRGKQVLNESYRQSEGVIKAIQPYIAKWNLQGVSIDQAVAGLAATQDKLTNPDANIRKQAYAELFVNSGLSGEDFIDILQEAGIEAPRNRNVQPQNLELPDEYKSAIDYASRLKQQEEEKYINSLSSQFEAVRNEVSPNGKYLYPKLFDANFNSEFVKPLVSKLMETLPDLSFGEAVKRAYYTLEGYQQNQNQGNFQQQNTARLPNENRTSTYRTIVSPTIRGQGSPATGGYIRPEADEVPDNIEDSIRMTMAKMKQSKF